MLKILKMSVTNPTAIKISISQVAPLIGLDHYNNFPKIICDLWQKYNFSDYKDKCITYLNNDQLAPNSSLKDKIKKVDESVGTNYIAQIKDLNDDKSKTSIKLVSEQFKIKSDILQNDKLDTNQKTELIKHINSITNQQHGVTNEDAILKLFEDLSESKIISTQGNINIDLSTKSPTINWSLVGKYDGITENNELVEAKMRQKSLFKKMRDYENVQVQLYLHCLKLEKGYLIEAISNKKGEMKTWVNEINYDESYVIGTVIPRVVKFTEFFEKFLDDEDMKQIIINGDLERKIYNHFYEHFLNLHIEYDY